MRLTWRSPTANATTAERIVMPRRRSMSPVSVWVVPASTLPSRSMTPVSKSRRSVRLVLPASTCARMPMLTVSIGWRVLESSHPDGRRDFEASHCPAPVVDGTRRGQAPRPPAPGPPVYRPWGDDVAVFGRRFRRHRSSGSVPPTRGTSASTTAEPGPDDVLLAETVARHFEDAVLEGSTVRLGFADLSVRCEVGEVGRLGDFYAAPLYFWLSGGDIGAQPIFASNTLPLLTAPGSTVLSLFILDTPDGRTVEVRVNGSDWAPSAATFARVEPEPPGGVSLLRELAVLVPREPAPPLERAAVQRTLRGFDAASATPLQTAGWPGWRAHSGVLGPPLTAAQVAELEVQTGPLPADYRAFLTEVAGSGAGPGYGLVRPVVHDEVIPLAHAGCGVTWLLRLDGEHRGRVWVDAGGSDRTVAEVASSFSAWYRAWLDAAVRESGPWAQWDASYCATPSMLSQMLDEIGDGTNLAGRIRPGGISLISGGGYLPEGAALDPCHPCVAIAAQCDLPPEVFAPGVLSTGS